MVCRSLAMALATISKAQDKTFSMFSLCDKTRDLDQRYLTANAFIGFGYNRLRFCIKAISKAPSNDCLVIAHINLLPLAFTIKAISPKTRIILIAHGKEVWSTLANWKKKFLNKNVEIWAVSTFTQKVLIEVQKIKTDNIRILNNCLDPFFRIPKDFLKPDHLLSRFKIKSDDLVLLTISRLTAFEKNKGYDLVLDCISELIDDFPHIKYLLAGKASSTEQQRLSELINNLHLKDNVILPGFITAEEITDHHLLADIFILPSYKEGFGLVFLEALACGSKVIAGNKDGSADALLNGELGTLINPESKTEILSSLKCLLKQEANTEAAQRRQRLTLETFSFEHYKSKVAALINHKH